MNKACFVAKIDVGLAEKLEADLTEQGFELKRPEYTVFSAQKKGVSCTLYESGKLMVQGKDKDEFIEFYLEPEILGSVEFSYPEVGIDMTARIGVDEAGKGDFFGPLCIAGVYASGEADIKVLLEMGVKDSKRMTDVVMVKLAKKIKERFAVAVVPLMPYKYNELYGKFKNLNRMLAWGHATVIAELVEKTGCKNVLIDKFGSEHLVETAVKRKGLSINLTQKVRAEEDVVVAAASIMARAAFVRQMERLEEAFEMKLPKGAGSQVPKAGVAFVKKHGKDELHRVAKLHFKTTNQVLDRAH